MRSKTLAGAVLAAFSLMLLLGGGCAASKPVQVALDYSPARNEPVTASLSSYKLSIEPFTDARTSKYLWSNRMIMREGDDAGVWVANAMRAELENAGAAVEALGAGARPSKGTHVSGRVNVLNATQTGWAAGLLGAATAGLSAHIDLNVEVMTDGIPVLTQQYSIRRKVHSNPVGVWLVGQSVTHEVPPALQKALRELIRSQVLPDIQRALSELGGSGEG
ncbi:MAG: hypothetical protein V2A58_13655 [Planctomycetota bacterium]